MAYLDHAATTPMRPEAVAAMLPFLTEHFGNPSGSHAVARRAKAAIEDARDAVAESLGCRSREVVFTGGGTEADNLAVGGRAASGRVVCPATEHPAVLRAVEARGGTVVPVAADGRIDSDVLAGSLGADVALVSVMLANNETGVVSDLGEVAAVVRAAAPAAVLHTDAVQAFPWTDLATAAAAADLVSVSAHKFGGPKGVGALVVREGTRLAPISHGGGQEQSRRSGTHNVAGIVAMAAAMTATVAQRTETVARVRGLRDRLVDGIRGEIPDVVETAGGAGALPGIAHLRFRGFESESLLFLLDDAGVCASAGSSCASGAVEPSHVLVAMGVPRDEALASVRFSLGWSSTAADVDEAVKAVAEATARLRAGS